MKIDINKILPVHFQLYDKLLFQVKKINHQSDGSTCLFEGAYKWNAYDMYFVHPLPSQ